MRKKLIVFVLVLLIISIAFTGCSTQTVDNKKPQKEEKPTHGGEITVGLTGNLENLNPLLAKTVPEQAVVDLLFQGLIKLDNSLKPVACLADKWEVRDNGLKWVVTLKDKIYWHDGEPITGDDVIFTFDMIFNPEVKTQLRDELVNLDSYTKIDDKTIEFELYQPDPGFLYVLALKIVPKHKFIAEDDTASQDDTKDKQKGTQQEDLKELLADFNNNPVGSGPFKLINWDKQNQILELQASDYSFEKPYLESIKIQLYQDYQSAKTAFTKNELDLIPIQLEDWNLFQEKPGVNTYQFPDLYYEFLALNSNKGVFNNLNIRKAVMYGINRKKIVDEVLLGTGRVVNGPLPMSSWYYNHDIINYKYDPQAAKELLESEGWSDTDGDGLVDKDLNGDGKREPLHFEVLVNEENDIRYQTAARIKNNLEDIGIGVKINLKNWEQIVNYHIKYRRYDTVILGWDLEPDPDLKFAFHSSQIKSGYNFVSYKNETLDDLTVNARRTLDEFERRKILLKAQKIINEELPYIFLYTKDRLLATKAKIRGIIPNPNGFFWNVTQWWIPKNQRVK